MSYFIPTSEAAPQEKNTVKDKKKNFCGAVDRLEANQEKETTSSIYYRRNLMQGIDYTSHDAAEN